MTIIDKHGTKHGFIDNVGARKKQRSACTQEPSKSSLDADDNNHMMESDFPSAGAAKGGQSPIGVPASVASATLVGPVGPSWSCRGCGRCSLHHTTPLLGCWACLQVMLNGPTFDADRWGEFNICQQMRTRKLHAER